MCPVYLKSYFQRVSNVNCYSTRGSSLNYYVPKASGVIGKTFYFMGIMNWNSLTSNLKEIRSKSTFKKVIKAKLFESLRI